jgi:hypothetical protein
MSNTELTATRRAAEDGTEFPDITVNYEFGDNLTESVEIFGEGVVFNRFKAMGTIDVQAKIRAAMVDTVNKEGEVVTKAKGQEEIQEMLDEWKLGIKAATRKSPKEKLMSILEGMTPEDKAAFLADLATDVAE